MMGPWIATQLFVGKNGMSAVTRARIGDAIARAQELARIDAVMIWPSAVPGLTEELVRASRNSGISPFLWFPILADVLGVPVPPDSLTLSSDGSRGNGSIGAWEGLAGGEENFLFSCPNATETLDSAFQTYESLLSSLDVDGVMLDRIRFPSPANGWESLFCCFCESCRAGFHTFAGLSLDLMRQRARDFTTRIREQGPSELRAAWTAPGALWKAAGLEKLAAFRARSVTSTVRRFSSLARARGLGVGLDLFSPSLAPLVGQDYEVLSSLCDWIKPMIYCRAVGPAGLPLEIASLWKALSTLHSVADARATGDLLSDVFSWQLPGAVEELLRSGLPAEVISSELEMIRRMSLASRTRVYAGIEAVRMPEFGIDVTPAMLARSLRQLQAPADGIVASWNLLHIPEENLRLIGALKV
ncbi:MAG: hypothetical protein ABSB63_05675 [Spirochaetia bacterium]